MKAWMDGTNAIPLTSWLSAPKGIVVDHKLSRIFWADFGADKIQSSGLDGGEVTTLAQAEDPWGVAVDDDRLYFSTWSWPSGLESCDKAGNDVRMHHTENNPLNQINQLALIDSRLPNTTRSNDCADQLPTASAFSPRRAFAS